MKILNIHGYKGGAHNSAYTALSELSCDVISPSIDYDAESPENIICRLKALIKEENIGTIVGTSLGGFFAAVLSVETELPAVLVNPCLMPFLHLPRLNYTGNIGPFISMFGTLSELNTDTVSCIIGDSDEIIDTHDFTRNFLQNPRFCIAEGGKHSGATLPLKEYFSEVLDKH